MFINTLSPSLSRILFATVLVRNYFSFDSRVVWYNRVERAINLHGGNIFIFASFLGNTCRDNISSLQYANGRSIFQFFLIHKSSRSPPIPAIYRRKMDPLSSLIHRWYFPFPARPFPIVSTQLFTRPVSSLYYEMQPNVLQVQVRSTFFKLRFSRFEKCTKVYWYIREAYLEDQAEKRSLFIKL